MSAKRRVLIVGAGSIGERHVRCFLATERADVWVCEPSNAIRQAISSRYSIRGASSSLDEALHQSFDLAVIATPAHFHVPQAIQLCEQGISPLIEKPLSLSFDGIERLQRSLAEANVVAGVAYPYRAHPALTAMRESIKAGRFGRPLQVVVVAGQNFPTYRPAYRDTYYRSRATGGGAIQDALTHLINAVEWLVGPTESVVADAGRLKLDGVEVEDTAHVLARNGDVLTTYALNQHQPANELTITVVCERGQARFHGHGAKWSWLVDVDGQWEEEVTSGMDRDSLFRRQAEAFLDAVERQTEPLCGVAEGIVTLKSVLAILGSLESKRWESTLDVAPQ